MEYEPDGFAECKDNAMISAAIMANERSYTRLYKFGKSEKVDNIIMQEQTIHSQKGESALADFLMIMKCKKCLGLTDESLNEIMKQFFHRVDASEGGVKNTPDMFVKSDKIAFTQMMEDESDDCRYSQTIAVC